MALRPYQLAQVILATAFAARTWDEVVSWKRRERYTACSIQRFAVSEMCSVVHTSMLSYTGFAEIMVCLIPNH